LSLPKRRVDKRVYRNMKTRKNALKRGTNEITEKHFKYTEPQKHVRSLKVKVKGKAKAKIITKQ
jgi:hypothetical protein